MSDMAMLVEYWRFPSVVVTTGAPGEVQQLKNCTVDGFLLNGLGASDNDPEWQLTFGV